MIKTPAADMTNASLPVKMLPIIKRLIKTVNHLEGICVLPEDTIYKWHFIRDYMPELYKRHTSELYMNCVFCSNLVRSGCHAHCLKCSAGTYIHCNPLFPGIIYYGTGHPPYSMEPQTIPWYFRKSCSNFKRLPSKQYFRNLHVLPGSIDIYNFEVLEGLEKGLSAGEKPCHVCASVNYDLYRKCSGQQDFDTSTPCSKITTQLDAIYQEQA